MLVILVKTILAVLITIPLAYAFAHVLGLDVARFMVSTALFTVAIGVGRMMEHGNQQK